MEAFLFSVGVLGLEPRMTGPESVVLPLHHTPITGAKSVQTECKKLLFAEVQPDIAGANLNLRLQRYYFFPNNQNFLQKFYKKAQNFHFSFVIQAI